jgi:hypothetical protein
MCLYQDWRAQLRIPSRNEGALASRLPFTEDMLQCESVGEGRGNSGLDSDGTKDRKSMMREGGA